MDENSVKRLLQTLNLDAFVEGLRASYPANEIVRLVRWMGEDLPAQIAGKPTQRPADARMKPRVLYLSGLEESAWYSPDRFHPVRVLEESFSEIRREVVQLLNEDWPLYTPKSAGWNAYFLYDVFGNEFAAHTAKCPHTWSVISSLPRARNAYFSRLQPGAVIAPHHGPTNASLVAHLGLICPNGDCAIRVGDEERGWTEGKSLVFDDTFEQEAWNRTAHERINLLYAVWHPDLTEVERTVLGALEDKAKLLVEGIEGNAARGV